MFPSHPTPSATMLLWPPSRQRKPGNGHCICSTPSRPRVSLQMHLGNIYTSFLGIATEPAHVGSTRTATYTYMHTYVHVLYIYIERESERDRDTYFVHQSRYVSCNRLVRLLVDRAIHACLCAQVYCTSFCLLTCLSMYL